MFCQIINVPFDFQGFKGHDKITFSTKNANPWPAKTRQIGNKLTSELQNVEAVG